MESNSCSIATERGNWLAIDSLSLQYSCKFEKSQVRAIDRGWRGVIGKLATMAAVLMSGVLMAQMPSDANYRLAANDLVDFRVFQEPELDAVIRISGDGNGIFPLVGSVLIAGKTIGEATELLRKRYMAGYLVNPQVTLTVRTYARKVFTVLGQVQKPGSYEIEGSESISLLQALGMAGGYTRIANPGNVTVKRREGSEEKVYRFNAKKMAKSESDSNFVVKPGDVITVGESIF